MLLDSNGVPYSTGELVWSAGAGVQLEDYTPTKTFDMPESVYARQEDGKVGASFHYGNELSHHAQQLLALKYLRDNAGFDNLVWCVVHFGKGKSVIALSLVDDLWCESKEVVL